MNWYLLFVQLMFQPTDPQTTLKCESIMLPKGRWRQTEVFMESLLKFHTCSLLPPSSQMSQISIFLERKDLAEKLDWQCIPFFVLSHVVYSSGRERISIHKHAIVLLAHTLILQFLDPFKHSYSVLPGICIQCGKKSSHSTE